MATLIATAATARPLVIAHRGASAERPEHTIAAYREAIRVGADFIEPDLVATKDGVLVARHENEISGTTDVAAHPEFAARKATKIIDGVATTGWFTEDFTLAELKTLRARERLPQLRPANTKFDGQETIPTLDEIIALAQAAKVGIYPETKHPSYFRGLGLPLEPPLLAALKAAGWTTRAAPVFIQSFEVGNLKALRGQTQVRLIQLIGDGVSGDGVAYDTLVTPAGLKGVALYADGIGPAKDRVIGRDAAGKLLPPAPLVADAHAAGLQVHPWTFRPENYFLPTDLRRGADPAARGDIAAEYRAYLAAGVDGVFSDDPESAVGAIAPR
ncbi:glycerophosphodiester phosphodiesterase [Glacieibacterium frigidum]|nr:glycerophosphodiester phosphodiesterase [Glacieibacterium frigidum]